MNWTPAPSSSGINYQLIFQWLILIFGILSLIYMALKIKSESKNYSENCELKNFGPFSLLIPKWWSFDHQKNHYIRKDTYYDWFFLYKEIPSSDELTHFSKNYLEQNKIELDEDKLLTKNPEHLFLLDETHSNINEFLRIESTATQDITDRIYLDIVFIKLNNEDKIHYFLSQSSVLNGSVEGPFFEESMKQLKINKLEN